MSLLREDEISNIITTYKKLRSIQKTSQTLGYNVNTINKYVKPISSKNRHSPAGKGKEIIKMDLNTKNILAVYSSISGAAKETGINASNICHCLAGHSKKAGGYIWKYKNRQEETGEYWYL